jgi:hypothetical protein
MLLEKTQRRLCRLLFVFGCVLPTLAVAGFTSGRLRPSYVDNLHASLGERLGASIDCESFATPRPGVYELRQVTLASAVDGREFATCDTLRVTTDGGGVQLAAKSVSVRQPADGWALRLLESGLVAEGQIATLSVDGCGEYERVTASLLPGAAKVTCERGDTLVAKLDDTLKGGVCQVQMQAVSPIAAAWIPCEPLHALAAMPQHFSGSFTAATPLDGAPVSGALNGSLELKAIDFESLKAECGAVERLELNWNGGRIERFAGRVDLRGGWLSRSLVLGMYKHLTMDFFQPLADGLNDPAHHAWFGFTQLACDVELTDKGLVIVAGCGEIDGQTRSGAVAHAVLEHNGEALLKQPELRPLPVQRLVQAWRPDDLAEIPATSGAIEMAGRLPGMSPK